MKRKDLQKLDVVESDLKKKNYNNKFKFFKLL